MPQEKPNKKSDEELWSLLSKSISNGNYLFLKHAKKRLKDRNITDIDVLDILEQKIHRKSKRNKNKDSYTPGFSDWNYCVEGNDIDGHKIRVIFSFDSKFMVVITVIRIDD